MAVVFEFGRRPIPPHRVQTKRIGAPQLKHFRDERDSGSGIPLGAAKRKIELQPSFIAAQHDFQ
jgi:hypothetical protein